MSHHSKEPKESIIAVLENLMKQGRTEDMRSILEIDDRGTTLLHLAAKQNKLDLIQYLLNSNLCDVNAKTTSSTTPLIIAVLYNHFDAAKLLLDAGADMLISNLTTQYPLQLVLNKQRRTPEHVIEYFITKLKSDIEDNERVAEILVRAGCSLELILTMHDPQLTRSLLDNSMFVDVEDCTSLVVDYAMTAHDLENLRVILQHGPAALHRQRLFFLHLFHQVYGHYYDWKIVKRYVVQVVEWEIVTDEFLEFWANILSKSNAEIMETMIQWVVHVPSDNKYRQYLLAQAFGVLDYHVIGQALGNVEIDLNACGNHGHSPLHFAAIRQHQKNIHFLLNKGVSPDVRDDKGRTPLFKMNDSKCIQLLFKYGADVQSIDDNGKSAFDDTDFIPKIQIMQAHLAILQAQGVPINSQIHDKVKSFIFYDRFRQQIDDLKAYQVFESLTLFDVLAGKSGRLVRYVWDRQTVLKIKNYFRMRNIASYYHSRIVDNLRETMARRQTMSVIADMISKVHGQPVDLDHLVVIKIASFIQF